MHLAFFAYRQRFSGNSQDRRRARRAQDRRIAAGEQAAPSWSQAPGRFSSGQEARVRSADYGKRYIGGAVVVLGKADKDGHWRVKSSRRVNPLIVHDDHLEATVVARKAA